MPNEKKLETDLKLSRLLELVRQTTRYSISVIAPDQVEVIDERYLLDRLLRFPALRPTTSGLGQLFDDALETLSPGPTVTLDDRGTLDWLMASIEELDPRGKNIALNAACQGAVVLRGTYQQAEYFLLAALNHRVQP
jgi:hypothetical protein